MPHTKAEEIADDIIRCVLQSNYNLDGAEKEQHDELRKAVSDKLASLLADKESLLADKEDLIEAAAEFQDFDTENQVPVCHCCGMELDKDGKGHKSNCLANLILNQPNRGAMKAK